jgi:hypothetical protein
MLLPCTGSATCIIDAGAVFICSIRSTCTTCNAGKDEVTTSKVSKRTNAINKKMNMVVNDDDLMLVTILLLHVRMDTKCVQ